ncbi:GNAT family N-acetyltransferase [Pseudomonas sp. PDM33]|uniref:GNAT family N-acetyltransferase n=1 Tax=unclassified Pseudomonas TaxID=196821 RepID=UPI000ABF1465|nr:GNAT family N-acetyltransferase [Pseudomonas sp. 21]MBV7582974.1 GNAT family N-acetyltransferase [Pseudomonas sp. PDM33]
MSAVPPFPELHGERFRLRAFTDADQPAVFRALSHPEVIRYYGVSYATVEATREQMEWFERLHREGSGIWWAICRPEAPEEVVGGCGFNKWLPAHRRLSLGYWLLPEHWGQGVMSECLPLICRHAFRDMNVHRIEAEVEPENLASGRLLLRQGFTLEGRRRECEVKDGAFLSLDYYGLLAPAAESHP